MLQDLLALLCQAAGPREADLMGSEVPRALFESEKLCGFLFRQGANRVGSTKAMCMDSEDARAVCLRRSVLLRPSC